MARKAWLFVDGPGGCGCCAGAGGGQQRGGGRSGEGCAASLRTSRQLLNFGSDRDRPGRRSGRGVPRYPFRRLDDVDHGGCPLGRGRHQLVAGRRGGTAGNGSAQSAVSRPAAQQQTIDERSQPDQRPAARTVRRHHLHCATGAEREQPAAPRTASSPRPWPSMSRTVAWS